MWNMEARLIHGPNSLIFGNKLKDNTFASFCQDISHINWYIQYKSNSKFKNPYISWMGLGELFTRIFPFLAPAYIITWSTPCGLHLSKVMVRYLPLCLIYILYAKKSSWLLKFCFMSSRRDCNPISLSFSSCNMSMSRQSYVLNLIQIGLIVAEIWRFT